MQYTLTKLLAFCLLHATIAAANEATQPPVVMAHYMPWFKAEVLPDGGIEWDHWQWFGKGNKHDPDDILPNGRRDIASIYTPLIGPYHGLQASVLQYHCLTAKSAGIQGFIANWYGQENYTDRVFGPLLSTLQSCDMQGAICMEEKSWFPPYTQATSRTEAMDEAKKQIRYILETYAKNPAYWQWDQRPVLFLFTGHETGPLGKNSLSPEEIENVLSAFTSPRPFLVRGEIHPEYHPAVDSFFSWVGNSEYHPWYYQTANGLKVEKNIRPVIGSVSPGFDDSGVHGWGSGPRITSRRNGQHYTDTWNETLAGQPDVVQIVTWNDFQEGSTIEPTEEYGFDYIDSTEEHVEKYTGRTSYLKDNRWAFRLFAIETSLKNAAFSPRERSQLEARINGLRNDLIQGRRFLMRWKLKRLEKKLQMQ